MWKVTCLKLLSITSSSHYVCTNWQKAGGLGTRLPLYILCIQVQCVVMVVSRFPWRQWRAYGGINQFLSTSLAGRAWEWGYLPATNEIAISSLPDQVFLDETSGIRASTDVLTSWCCSWEPGVCPSSDVSSGVSHSEPLEGVVVQITSPWQPNHLVNHLLYHYQLLITNHKHSTQWTYHFLAL